MASISAADFGNYDPSTQLNRDREEMERQRVCEQIREREENCQAEVEVERVADKPAESDLSFELTKVVFSDSEILTQEELAAITTDYVGKAVTVKDLYAIVNRVNQLYADKGFLTRAFLTEQLIVGGVVKITPLEGRTGKVTVSGNKHTRESFIWNSLPPKEGVFFQHATAQSPPATLQPHERRALARGHEGGRKTRHDRLRAGHLRADQPIRDALFRQQRLRGKRAVARRNFLSLPQFVGTRST